MLCVHGRQIVEGAVGLRSQVAAASISIEPSNRTAEGSVDGWTGAHPVGLAQEEQARLCGTLMSGDGVNNSIELMTQLS